MLDVAQKAAEMAAGWLEQQGSSNVQADDRLFLLRQEALLHFSQGVEALPKETPYAHVVCLLETKKWLTKNVAAVALIQSAEAHWHPVRDTAYETYKRYLELEHDTKKAERHPEVIRAYQEQAKFLAELVIGKLGYLFESR
jgi:hypothetical protein